MATYIYYINMNIQMPEKGVAEAKGRTVFIKTSPFSMHSNSKNGQFYPNLGSNSISFRKVVFMIVMWVVRGQLQ